MYVVIMGGGSGKRFWPKSRVGHPKQFLKITGDSSMLKATYERALSITDGNKIFVVTNEKFAGKVKDDIPAMPYENIIQEPQARNTAPCIALSVFYLKAFFGDENILFMPADHLVFPVENFSQTVKAADERVNSSKGVIIFGIKPRYPETGYGYIKRGKEKESINKKTIFEVEKFVEKPDKETAFKYLKSREYLWNSGMFLFSRERLIKSFKRHLPDIYKAFENFDFGEKDGFSPEKLKEVYPKLEKVSVDNGLIEKENGVELIQCDFNWSDVGSWRALEEIWKLDSNNNALNGKCFSKDSSGNIADSGGKLITLLGVKDLIVINTDDALFVCSKDKVDDLKGMLEELEKSDLKEYL